MLFIITELMIRLKSERCIFRTVEEIRFRCCLKDKKFLISLKLGSLGWLIRVNGLQKINLWWVVVAVIVCFLLIYYSQESHLTHLTMFSKYSAWINQHMTIINTNIRDISMFHRSINRKRRRPSVIYFLLLVSLNIAYLALEIPPYNGFGNE